MGKETIGSSREEDPQGYFIMMRQVIKKYGIPETLYRDRHGIFERDSKGGRDAP